MLPKKKSSSFTSLISGPAVTRLTQSSKEEIAKCNTLPALLFITAEKVGEDRGKGKNK